MRFTLALLAALVLAPQASAARTILVRFSDPADATAKAASLGDDVVRQTAGHVAVVRVAPGESEAQALAAFSARRDVLYAEPNGFRRAFALNAPNDPGYASQWALSAISALAGWNLFPGSFSPAPGAKVGIVDTGVEASHPDLAPNLTSSGATCVNGCVAGNPTDINGHGTHVAGIAAAAANNATGVAGLAFSSPIVAVRVFHNDPTDGLIASDADVADGIVWAEQHGVRVINLSLGAPTYSQTICSAISTAINTYHVVVVAAAGNSHSSVATYPASCPGVIGVSATDPSDAAASFSNYGAPNVFVSAPGVSILSTYPGNTYAYEDGTSMASPYVTGLAALLLGEHPTASVSAVRQILAKTSDKVGGVSYGADPYATCTGCTWDPHFGYGRIDVGAALAAPVPPPQAPPPPPPPPPPLTLDTKSPSAHAYATHGRRRQLIRLRYRVSDDRGETAERITVYRKSKKLSIYRRRLRATLSQIAYSVIWHAPRKAGKYRFCVVATDSADNHSKPACAAIRVR
ncbi:MAG TPA: S8 family serine peptidase [Gaiellaceae bacterium]|nr:S8 family serine peptidase [Gaiellaceae bacterium]